MLPPLNLLFFLLAPIGGRRQRADLTAEIFRSSLSMESRGRYGRLRPRLFLAAASVVVSNRGARKASKS
jgi:hypothetical protein